MWRTPAIESRYSFYRNGWVNPESERTTEIKFPAWVRFESTTSWSTVQRVTTELSPLSSCQVYCAIIHKICYCLIFVSISRSRDHSHSLSHKDPQWYLCLSYSDLRRTVLTPYRWVEILKCCSELVCSCAILYCEVAIVLVFGLKATVTHLFMTNLQ